MDDLCLRKSIKGVLECPFFDFFGVLTVMVAVAEQRWLGISLSGWDGEKQVLITPASTKPAVLVRVQLRPPC